MIEILRSLDLLHSLLFLLLKRSNILVSKASSYGSLSWYLDLFQRHRLLWLLMRDPLLGLFCFSLLETSLLPACQPLRKIVESDISGLVSTKVLEYLSGFLRRNLKINRVKALPELHHVEVEVA